MIIRSKKARCRPPQSHMFSTYVFVLLSISYNYFRNDVIIMRVLIFFRHRFGIDIYDKDIKYRD